MIIWKFCIWFDLYIMVLTKHKIHKNWQSMNDNTFTVYCIQIIVHQHLTSVLVGYEVSSIDHNVATKK
jgi:hypothetical protein